MKARREGDKMRMVDITDMDIDLVNKFSDRRSLTYCNSLNLQKVRLYI